MFDFNRIIERIKQYKQMGGCFNEENTKRTLILPFLVELGYDVFSHEDIESEYVADMRSTGSERVDYAIMLNDKPRVFIEAKPLGTELTKYIGQLQRYYVASETVKVGILTDGDTYMFFDDSRVQNIMDITPFYTLKISNMVDDTILSLFTKQMLGDDQAFAKYRQSIALDTFIKDNIFEVSDSFLAFTRNYCGENITQLQIKEVLNNLMVSSEACATELAVLDLNVSTLPERQRRTKTKKPISYSFMGSEVEFTTWKVMTLNILKFLLAKDSNFYNYLRNNMMNSCFLIYESAVEFKNFFNDTTNTSIIKDLALSDTEIMALNSALYNGRVYLHGSSDVFLSMIKDWLYYFGLSEDVFTIKYEA